MLYLIYQHLDPHGHYITAINLMRYLTFRTGMALFTAQIVVALMGNRFIDWMRVKQGRGQPIRTDGPAPAPVAPAIAPAPAEKPAVAPPVTTFDVTKKRN